MSKKYMFPNNKIGFDDYLSTIQKEFRVKPVFCIHNSLKEGIESLTQMDDLEKRQKMIDASFLVDRRFQGYDKEFIKIPIMMTIANMMGNYYDSISELNASELALLGGFSYVYDSGELSQFLKVFGCKPLIEAVVEKTPDQSEQERILSVVENKYYEFGIDEADDKEVNRFRLESVMAVRNSSSEELLGMASTLDDILNMETQEGKSI